MNEDQINERFSQKIELHGHIIDSLILPRVFETIMADGESDFEVEEFTIGRHKADKSYARIRITTAGQVRLNELLDELRSEGAEVLEDEAANFAPADMDGVFPENFYATTNLQTTVRLGETWIQVDRPEMDCGLRLNSSGESVQCVPMHQVRQGDQIAVGKQGIRITPLERARQRDIFEFMGSAVSSEKPKKLLIDAIAEEIREIKERGERVLVVGGPAIIHTGAGPYLSELIAHGFVDVLFAGNALALHDLENALYGTSLGVSLQRGENIEGGHEHHLRTVNLIRRQGSIKNAVDGGIITSGVMFECVRKQIDVVLAGSVRDDGPLPDVLTDMVVAQDKMRSCLDGVQMALMISTMLHSIATGNILPAYVKTVCVDINPATVTKLADRGSHQALGLVTDVESFLRELCGGLVG
ncbi:MAG: TIGR00300 family protein [Candidatus Latescibacteria bacterium]|jgi:lysine-ketoglutarate reductase/saccharopine dehydrogenase-like protein (TIGR00300 family)|nr:TIGR00300 family protein [Candidatus Latescibacterota bacterium]